MIDNQNESGSRTKHQVYIPTATYRLQFNHDFRFDQAEQWADYFQRLGVSDIYASPIWTARKGSMHCYDVTDHSQVNADLGGETAFKSFSNALKSRNLGMVVDVVPNHMGIMDPSNRQWWDVLENGSCSPYANFFDIDWRAFKEELHDRVELPTLGQQFGICLENGEFKVSFSDDGEFLVHYYETVLPTGPRTWVRILQMVLSELQMKVTGDDDDLIELESVVTALGHLPMREDTDECRIRERQREKEVCKRRLRALLKQNALVRDTIHAVLDEVNGIPGQPESFDTLELFLEDQTYRLCFWRVAGDEINYRRFFDINELAAIRVENPSVFQHVHALIFSLIQAGDIRGLRIDHPDGLLNPPQYFTDLQRGCLNAIAGQGFESPNPIPDCEESPCAMWVIAEKILEHKERIRPDWAVHGTTGYEFVNLVNGVFVDQRKNNAFLSLYSKFVGSGPNYAELKTECKKLILDNSMAGELYTLARKLDRISETNRRTRDFTLQTLQEALAEFIAAFPVYRSYIRPDSTSVDEDDRFYIESAIRIAKRRNQATDPTLFDFIGSILLLDGLDELPSSQKKQHLEFVLAVQQITGPVMAKGLEDTAFYRDFPLSSLNEVGGEPERFGVSVTEFHERCSEQARLWPASMISTSTHDTKRGEDVRARINVLSEMPREWERAIFRWRRLNSRRKHQVEGHHVPTGRNEYLFYQTLLGIWPLTEEPDTKELTDRMIAYMIKATREAKVLTSWVKVNEEYEAALSQFITEALDPVKSSKFLNDFKDMARLVALRGANNSLSQVLMKLTAPGVPDFYQGTELWRFDLVDPDNRRPVDYALRSRLLEEIISRQDDPTYLADLMSGWKDGRIKMMVTHKGLAFRRAYQYLYQSGVYVPLFAEGQAAGNVLAYAQTKEDQPWAITVVPRLLAEQNFPEDRLIDETFWGDTTLRLPDNAPTRWHNIFTGESFESNDLKIPIKNHLGAFPVALLVSQ